ncbi:MAG: chromosomal replication initiator protein DnaA, partial [Verrucomicrobia bacterium]|nr:chromosomal replication initiator protein DnaA [Verrucomicrobiota bacterium]
MRDIDNLSSARAAELWQKVCDELRKVVHPDIYTRWISVITPCTLDDSTLVLEVENDFYQSWLEENYLPLIHNAISTISSEELNTTFQVATGESRANAGIEKPQAGAQALLPLNDAPVAPPVVGRSRRNDATSNGAKLNPRFTFDNFIIGPSNSFAHAASLAVAQAPGRAYNPLFVYGGTGLGKTHLMAGIGHHVLKNARARICYVSSEAFLNEYISALTSRSLVQFRRKYRSTDLLLIDDIHFLASKEAMQEEFFHTFNTLFDARKQIVMTSDRPASEISGLEKRLVSRFEWGLVVELESPDLETRMAILKHRQAGAE